MIPVLAGLCIASLSDEQHSEEVGPLLEHFVEVSKENGNAVHFATSLAMKAGYLAERGDFNAALEDVVRLQKVYAADQYSHRMSKAYGKDYAMEAISQSIFWFLLVGRERDAVEQGLFVLNYHVPLQNVNDVDSIMALLLPTILVLKFVGRGEDGHYILSKYVVNAFHDNGRSQMYWVELFNPLMYLLEIVKMEESAIYNSSLLGAIQDWVLDNDNSYYSPEHLRLAHMIMGEICFRLGQQQLAEPSNSMRLILMEKAKHFLQPIADDIHSEAFLVFSANKFLLSIN
jgi:hypothetical protein